VPLPYLLLLVLTHWNQLLSFVMLTAGSQSVDHGSEMTIMHAMESSEALHRGPSLPDVLWTIATVILTGLLGFATYWLF